MICSYIDPRVEKNRVGKAEKQTQKCDRVATQRLVCGDMKEISAMFHVRNDADPKDQ